MTTKILLASAAALSWVAMSLAPANAGATISYDLLCGIGGTCGTTSYGTITLTQVDSKTVSVSEVLAAGDVYAGSGAGDALAFNVDKGVTLTNIQPSADFAVDSTPKGVPYGNFGYAVDYEGKGTSPPNFSSFTFTTSDGSTLSLSDFVKNAAGYFFASDIGVPNGRGSFVTGNVASNDPVATPEPATIAVMGMGLAGLGFTRLRKRVAPRALT